MKIVISYAREDRALVEELVGTLRDLGHEPWTDAGAHSGGRWWNEIIHRIQTCAVLLLVMSPAYLASKACALERQYAMQLGRPVLPIRVAPFSVQGLPSELVQVQILDYTTRDAPTGARLFQALTQLPPPPPLPHPPPPPPPPPLSYLNGIADRLDRLPPDLNAQHEIVTALTQGLRSADPEERETAIALLRRYLSHANRMHDPAERAAAALGSGNRDTWPNGPHQLPPAYPGPPPKKRSPVVTILAVVGAATLLFIVLGVVLASGGGEGGGGGSTDPTAPAPPVSAQYLPGADLAQQLAPHVYADTGIWPASIACDDLVAEIGATAGCTVSNAAGGRSGVIVEFIGGSALWKWDWA
ncbi:MAG TPA: toll/interleukin-1 receptor domain-containing protein [Pseudonocardia sp.]|nr:toll/interleukin-1 receptor domain-containing protein [Pseudonocardia sp.]